MQIITSQDSPLQIASIHFNGGEIGMSICPGKKGPSTTYGKHLWDRDLFIDMADVRDFGACAVITLLEDYEFDALGLNRMTFNRAVVNNNMEWRHIRTLDGGIPDERFDDIWYDVKTHTIDPILAAGGKVFVHCRGGLGRTGLVVAQYLLEEGHGSPEEIMELVRAARPGAIENSMQEEYLRGFA